MHTKELTSAKKLYDDSLKSFTSTNYSSMLKKKIRETMSREIFDENNSCNSSKSKLHVKNIKSDVCNVNYPMIQYQPKESLGKDGKKNGLYTIVKKLSGNFMKKYCNKETELTSPKESTPFNIQFPSIRGGTYHFQTNCNTPFTIEDQEQFPKRSGNKSMAVGRTNPKELLGKFNQLSKRLKGEDSVTLLHFTQAHVSSSNEKISLNTLSNQYDSLSKNSLKYNKRRASKKP
eukprot:CAMPEP_0168337392 /NCGR_PEP_ID=MMETSP0213-20121227/12152_1 /TAXON_ID=151035 /ORGANISM="Euplotes harpa, Strain FSP1.4" /LENGTH=231 /DNA_ID=CAMNT_0008342851 /DNA_START=324 /DNA_END=1016 /DNA_ORIENTATION=-